MQAVVRRPRCAGCDKTGLPISDRLGYFLCPTVRAKCAGESFPGLRLDAAARVSAAACPFVDCDERFDWMHSLDLSLDDKGRPVMEETGECAKGHAFARVWAVAAIDPRKEA